MAEVIFKLLRCDAEASHLLGWAKNEVKRLIDHAGLPAFNRTWALGDVTVRAQYFGGLARLWLEAVGTERLAVWTTLPNPHVYRAVVLGTIDRGKPKVTGTVLEVGDPDPNTAHNFTSYYTAYFRDSTGAVVGELSGTVDYFSDLKIGVGDSFRYVFVNYIPSVYVGSGYGIMGPDASTRIPGVEWQQFNGEYERYAGWISSSWAPCSPTYEGVLAADETSGRGGKLIVAYTSDGEKLAEEFVTTSGYSLGTSVWDGSGSAQLFETVGGVTAKHHKLTFTVPEDCIAPLTAAPPPYPGTDLPGAWATDWAETYAQGKEREKAWFVGASEQVVSDFFDGSFALPHSWDYRIKKDAPVSDGTYRRVVLTASYTDTVVSDSSSNLTQPGEKITRRATILSYIEQTEDGSQHKTDTITGTRTQTVQEHKDRYGTRQLLSRVDTYDNWYESAASPATDVEAMLPHAFLKDKTPYGMGLFWTGAWQAVGGQHQDSSFDVPAFNLTQAEYEPPAPAYFNLLEGVAPLFVLDYHAAQKPRYKAGSGNTEWLSSALGVGMTVKVVPVGQVKDGESLGMFGESGQQVEVYGSASFAYDYFTGQLRFKSWTPLPGGADSVRIQIPEEYEFEANALIIYSGIKWDDVKETARAQRKALADPNDPAHDPLMKAVLTALTPQE